MDHVGDLALVEHPLERGKVSDVADLEGHPLEFVGRHDPLQSTGVSPDIEGGHLGAFAD